MSLKILLALLCRLALLSSAGANGLDPLRNFCRRWYHQAQVKNQVLYIDGGIESFSDRSSDQYGIQPNWTGPITTGPNNYMIAINMSTSWDWKSNISEAVINKTVDPLTGNPPPNTQNAALFHGPRQGSQIYLYGGETPSINQSFPMWQWPTTNQYTLWGFDTITHLWTQYDVYATVPERPSQGAAAEAPDLGLAFYLNGMITQWSSPTTSYLGNRTQYLDGMVILDLEKKTATNRSTDSIADGLPRVRGGMIYVPGLGPKGVLVTIGGATRNVGGLNLVSMKQVNVFDVSTALPAYNGSDNGWYTQTITGVTPQPRVDFCLVLASAPDNSSHNIYMYGGWDPTQENTYFDEVWVLSLPSFTWVGVYNGTAARFGHTCHIVGNRQMITVGGLHTSNVIDSCDWEFESVAIYDLTEGTVNGWGSVFSAYKAPYEVNKQIAAAIGGGPRGNATKLLPNGGWSTTLIAHIFTGMDNQTAPVSPGGIRSANPTTSSQGHHTAAIVGGIVGGSILLLLIAGTALLWKLYGLGLFKTRDQSRQDQYVKPELHAEDMTLAAAQAVRGPEELSSGVFQNACEAPPNSRSELSEDQLPVEISSSVIYEKA